MDSPPVLVLASASPRRADLLASLGVAFERRPADVDERRREDETPYDYVERLAESKAFAVPTSDSDLVLAADTVVLLDSELLGKPGNRADAAAMLRSLAGREHVVLTGVCLRDASAGKSASEVDRTRVAMGPLSEAEIAWYVATGEPDDKAGSYAMQGLGALFVERIQGNASNVIGLPLPVVYRLFLRLGHDLKALCAAREGVNPVDRLLRA